MRLPYYYKHRDNKAILILFEDGSSMRINVNAALNKEEVDDVVHDLSSPREVAHYEVA